INLWLVLNKKLRSLESGSQIVLEDELFESARRSSRSVELIDVAAETLGPIQRSARILQQPACIATIVRIETDADTTRHEDFLIFKQECLVEGTLDSARYVRSILSAR